MGDNRPTARVKLDRPGLDFRRGALTDPYTLVLTAKGGRMTEDQIDLMFRLEGIFQPAWQRARERKRKADNPQANSFLDSIGYFAHYTTADAGMQIIDSKRLWMRNATCMSDYREVQHGFDLIAHYLSDTSRKQKFNAAIDAVFPGMGVAVLKLFDNWWSNIRMNTYVASISEHNREKENLTGRLSMWRAFGPIGPRVALVVSMPWASDVSRILGLAFGPVIYCAEDAAETILDEALDNILKEQAVCCTKHIGFEEEREWRAIWTPTFGNGGLLERATQVIAGIPQTVLQIPLDGGVDAGLESLDLKTSLERVIIGPTEYQWVMAQTFADRMEKCGIVDSKSKVWSSRIPIRG